MNYRSQPAVGATRGRGVADSRVMAVFMDLNVCYTPDRNRLKSLVETAANREFVQPGSHANLRESGPADDNWLSSCCMNVVATGNGRLCASLLLPVVYICWLYILSVFLMADECLSYSGFLHGRHQLHV